MNGLILNILAKLGLISVASAQTLTAPTLTDLSNATQPVASTTKDYVVWFIQNVGPYIVFFAVLGLVVGYFWRKAHKITG